MPVGGSSSGRTSVSGSDYLGSIPSPPAKNLFPTVPYHDSPPYRAGGSSSGRTPAFGAGYLGSIPSPPATFLGPSCYLSQRRQIDHESDPYLAYEDPFVGLVDLLDGNHFDIGFDSVRCTEIEHLLCSPDTADDGHWIVPPVLSGDCRLRLKDKWTTTSLLTILLFLDRRLLPRSREARCLS
jgi:hypothetical protein